MKKILFFLALGLALAANAQTPKWGYGDIMYPQTSPDTTYFYQWSCQGWGPGLEHPGLELNWFGLPNGEAILQYNFTSEPTAIMGVAVSFYLIDRSTNRTMDTLWIPEYVRLYDATPDSFPLKAEKEIHIEDPHRSMFISFYQGLRNSDCSCLGGAVATVPIYEYYFDKPVVVDDSFYVGMTSLTIRTCYEDLQQFIPSYEGYIHYFVGFNNADCDQIPLQKIRRLNLGSRSMHIPEYLDLNAFLMMYPLLEPSREAKCRSIENFHLVSINNDRQPLLAWNGDRTHTYWEVSFGPQGTEPDRGTRFTASSPSILLDSIENNTHYVAYVRAYCEFQGHENYTDWSDGIDIYRRWVPDNPPDTSSSQPEAIPLQASDNSFVTLMPNPASSLTQVISGYSLQGFDLVDMHGRTVKSGSLDGHSATIDLDDCPKGVFVALIRTAGGTAAKRLVVE